MINKNLIIVVGGMTLEI